MPASAANGARRLISAWLSHLMLALTSALARILRRPTASSAIAGNQHILAAPHQRPDWPALTFTSTEPVSPSFSWSDTPIRAYRPWHDGPHHVTMGIQRTSLDNWVEIDREYLSRYRYKRTIFHEHRSLAVCSEPGSGDACFEALSALADFLPRRYPTMFRATDVGLENRVTGDEWDLRRDGETWKDHHPLQVMGLLTTEDWFVLQTDADGETTRLTAGAVCFPGTSPPSSLTYPATHSPLILRP